MSDRPLILVTNDDGITAPGIRHLVESIADLGEVVVVAPDSHQSGMGHAITISNILKMAPHEFGMAGVQAYKTSGTPVDCVKLAGRKVETWYLRQHPKVRALQFKEGVKRQERINARVRYIEGDMPPTEKAQWLTQFVTEPEPLTLSEKAEFMATLTGVSLASDAFFPFRDSLDVASTRGVSYVVAAGGSVADEEVITAADEYKMVMAFSGLRLFHH